MAKEYNHTWDEITAMPINKFLFRWQFLRIQNKKALREMQKNHTY
jgi:hypothetical protein